MLSILVLGLAAGGGFRNGTAIAKTAVGSGQAIRRRWRERNPVAVSADGEHRFLLNASPDVRQQIERTPSLQPRDGPRHSPIAGVVLTNTDVDHVAGLLTPAGP